jgi:hypothetical protein
VRISHDLLPLLKEARAGMQPDSINLKRFDGLMSLSDMLARNSRDYVPGALLPYEPEAVYAAFETRMDALQQQLRHEREAWLLDNPTAAVREAHAARTRNRLEGIWRQQP